MLKLLLNKLFTDNERRAPDAAAFDGIAAADSASAGLAAARGGRHQEALEYYERACALDSRNEEYHHICAELETLLGNSDAALRHCEAALALCDDFPAVHTLMARLTLRGMYYLKLISSIQTFLRPRTYLEVGVDTGSSIILAHPETRVIGLDPAPKIQQALGAHISVRAMTSDAFFAAHDVRAEFGGLPVDLAFIDGMHRFEFALRDFINIEKHCAPESTVLIHDCYPLNRVTAERECRTGFWSGDTWRTALALKKYRPDLSFHTLAAPPTGLGMVRGLDPGSRVLEEKYDDIVSEFRALDYSVLDADKAGMLSLHPGDWDSVRAILQ